MKYLSILRYSLIGIGILLILLMAFGVFDVENPVLNVKEDAVSILLTWAYILLGLAVLTAVFMPLINIVQNPKNAVRSLIGLGVIAVVLVISYALSSDTPIKLSGSITATPAELKWTDTGLYVTYILLGAAVAAIFLGELMRLVKK